MPCRDYDTDCKAPEETYVNGLREALSQYAKPSLLCEAYDLLEQHGLLNKISPELKAWHKKHEDGEADKVRLEAAEKLSERERRLLGIDLAALKLKVK